MKEGLEQELCPRCEKPVYDAEGFPAGGRRYHKRCFKCFSCSKKLEPTTVLCHKVRHFSATNCEMILKICSGWFILPHLPSQGGAQGESEDIRQHERDQASGREGKCQRESSNIIKLFLLARVRTFRTLRWLLTKLGSHLFKYTRFIAAWHHISPKQR